MRAGQVIAPTLHPNENYSVPGQTTFATHSTPLSSCQTNETAESPDVWFAFTVSEPMVVALSTCSPAVIASTDDGGWNSALSVFVGSGCPDSSASCVAFSALDAACSDDCDEQAARVVFHATPDSIYKIAVHGGARTTRAIFVLRVDVDLRERHATCNVDTPEDCAECLPGFVADPDITRGHLHLSRSASQPRPVEGGAGLRNPLVGAGGTYMWQLAPEGAPTCGHREPRKHWADLTRRTPGSSRT